MALRDFCMVQRRPEERCARMKPRFWDSEQWNAKVARRCLAGWTGGAASGFMDGAGAHSRRRRRRRLSRLRALLDSLQTLNLHDVPDVAVSHMKSKRAFLVSGII